MGIRDRIKNKARSAIRRATGAPEHSKNATPDPKVKAWEPYTPRGPEGHEAMEEVQDVISFADTSLDQKAESTDEVPEHVSAALKNAKTTSNSC